MLEQLSSSERRRVLLSSRILYRPLDVPRKRALAAMAENALFVAGENEWLTANDVLRILAEIGSLPSLRLPEMATVLNDLTRRGRLERMEDSEQLRYGLKRRQHWLDMGKQVLAAALLLPFMWAAARISLTYAAGDNWVMRLASGTTYFGLGLVLWLLLVKIALFRNTKLKDLFPVWSEIKELF